MLVAAMNAHTHARTRRHIGKAWSNMLAIREAGLARAIGVSNFYRAHLQHLLEKVIPADRLHADAPVANEIYIDVMHPQHDFVRWMQEKCKMRVFAYRSIAFVGTYAEAESMGMSQVGFMCVIVGVAVLHSRKKKKRN